MDRSSRQKTNKATQILNDTVENLDLIDIFRTLHQKKKKSNMHSSQMCMEHSQELMTYLGTKLTSTKLRA